MLRLCAAPRKRKNHVHRFHASRKQTLAVIWGCFRSGGSATYSHAALSLEWFC